MEEGGSERYLSRAVVRARILNNSWSAEEVEDLATSGHFVLSINIPPSVLQKVFDRGPRARNISRLRTSRPQFALSDRYRTLGVFRVIRFNEILNILEKGSLYSATQALPSPFFCSVAFVGLDQRVLSFGDFCEISKSVAKYIRWSKRVNTSALISNLCKHFCL